MSNSKTTYLNRAQQEALAVAANTEVDICARRFGKSFGIVHKIVAIAFVSDDKVRYLRWQEDP